MSDKVVCDTLRRKKRAPLSDLEIRQITSLRKVYGTNLVLIAVRHAENAEINKIARLLIQMGGFRDHLDSSLFGVLIDRASASKYYDETQLAIADRLRKAVSPIADKELENLTLGKEGNTAFGLWIKRTGAKEISQEDRRVILASMKKYGPKLVMRGILHFTPQLCKQLTDDFERETGEDIQKGEELEDDHRGENWRIRELRRWLRSICNRDWSHLYKIDSSPTDDPLLRENWDIPAPLPMRAGRYFWAKTNLMPTSHQARKIYELVEAYSADRVIYAMSCIPGRDFDLEKVHLACMSPMEREEYLATLEWDAMMATLGLMGEEGDVSTEAYEDDPLEFGWTSDNRVYEYSNYDPEALDSDEIFNESGLPTSDDYWDDEAHDYADNRDDEVLDYDDEWDY